MPARTIAAHRGIAYRIFARVARGAVAVRRATKRDKSASTMPTVAISVVAVVGVMPAMVVLTTSAAFWTIIANTMPTAAVAIRAAAIVAVLPAVRVVPIVPAFGPCTYKYVHVCLK